MMKWAALLTSQESEGHLGQSIRECSINTDQMKIIMETQNCEGIRDPFPRKKLAVSLRECV